MRVGLCALILRDRNARPVWSSRGVGAPWMARPRASRRAVCAGAGTVASGRGLGGNAVPASSRKLRDSVRPNHPGEVDRFPDSTRWSPAASRDPSRPRAQRGELSFIACRAYSKARRAPILKNRGMLRKVGTGVANSSAKSTSSKLFLLYCGRGEMRVPRAELADGTAAAASWTPRA